MTENYTLSLVSVKLLRASHVISIGVSWAICARRPLLATYPYTTRHAATEPGLYNERNQ